MPHPLHIYGSSLALLTDLYQLTMAQGYWKAGRTGDHACFLLSYRSEPFDGGYTVAAGLAAVIEFVERFAFADDDLAYLAEQTGNDGERLFDPAFLKYLRSVRFEVDVDAMPEGTVAFAHEPLVRVTGPLLQCQLLETPLLTLINFPTLIATKAARICQAARGDAVLEFGLRRAQGIDGGVTAARAAYVGGCAGTSNVLAGRLFGIPVGGTHAHSWVMSFDDELESFLVYADALPNNAVFLVDTYDTLDGVRKAVTAGQRLRERGHEMIGIRLDSGDLAYLSIEARKVLDAAGFTEAKIYASNDLDEHLIESLKAQGAKITMWGVGTKLATAFDDPALGGVYKLSAIRAADGAWRDRVKLSEQAVKTTNPGMLTARRYRDAEGFVADLIHDVRTDPGAEPTMVDPLDPTRRRTLGADLESEELLVPIFRGGRRVYDPPPIAESRARTLDQLAGFHAGVKRFVNPHRYPVGLERSLYDHKAALIRAARESDA